MQMLIDDGFDKKIFHWTEFPKGLSTDDYVMSELIERIHSKRGDYLDFNGLFDRRYLPVSLLKRPAQCISLVQDIINLTGRKESDQAVLRKIAAFFRNQETQDDLASRFDQKGKPLSDVKVLAEHYPRSPYQYLEEEDQIWLYSKNNQMAEFTRESEYFDKINKEWEHFPSIYVSYVMRNTRKSEARRHESDVFEIVKKEIASL